MNVTLPKQLEEFVNEQVQAGKFFSVEQAICEGLKLLQEQAAWRADVAAKIEEGFKDIEAGRVFTKEETLANLAERKKNWLAHRER